MLDNSVTLIGCGAQAKYVLEIFARTNTLVSQVCDPIGHRVGERIGVFTIKTFNTSEFLPEPPHIGEKHSIILCMHDNQLKGDIFRKLKVANDFVNAVHPDSTIASTVKLGHSVIVNARAVIQPYAQIGNGCMLHAGTVVEHDCTLEDFVNLAPGVILAGRVRIGEGATLYSGSVVAPNVKIGKYAVVGAGSLVLKDIPDRVLAYGKPAKTIRELTR